jgi:hypothetical protein
MTRFEAWLFQIANALVGATGLAYAWTAYFATSDDPYAVVNHPLQPVFQHAHVVVAPLLVFMVGVVWRAHAQLRLQSDAPERRSSGWSLLLTFAPAALSGYALQIAAEERWRLVWVAVHLTTCGAWILGSLVHLVAPRFGGLLRRRPAVESSVQ